MKQQFYNKWQHFVANTARRYSPVVARYGWTAEDCSQHALLTLWSVAERPKLWAMADPDVYRYLFVATRQSIRRVASKGQKSINCSFDLRHISRAEDRVRDELVAFVNDAVQSARDPAVAEYLAWKFFVGPKPNLTKRELRKVHNRTARWLMEELEGKVRHVGDTRGAGVVSVGVADHAGHAA